MNINRLYFFNGKAAVLLIVIIFKVRIPWKIQIKKKPMSIIITEKQESFYIHCEKGENVFYK